MIKKLVCVLILSAIFMATPTWGMLEKSQVDNETIEEAIDRKIGEHNADEEAHLGVGESLQSHKASEIIDHLASSVITDKIKDFEILLSKVSFDKMVYINYFDSVAEWLESGPGTFYNGPGCLSINSGSTGDKWKSLEALNDGVPADFDKNPVFETAVSLNSVSDIGAYFGLGPAYNSPFVGFKFVNSSVYACWNDDEGENLSLISGGDPYNLHVYRVVFISGSKIDFYIDGVLKFTADENLPSGPAAEFLVCFSVEATGSGTNKALWVNFVRVIEDR